MLKFFSIASLVAGGLFAATAALAAGPTISTVSPTTATTNVPVNFTATVNSVAPIQYCDLYVDLADEGPMAVTGNTASRGYTFTAGGSRIAFVFCKDVNNGMGAGPNTSIWVEGALVNQQGYGQNNPPAQTPTPVIYTAPTPTPSTVAAARTLVKLVCPAGATVNDPCKAVYYVGADGKRHAFPNSQTYFTWYLNFNNVNELSSADMATLPLGKNVTYRPGTRMVKFTTDNKVYAVAANGTLRWVKSEALAVALFGLDWSKRIDDISDTFYTNYTFGADINSTADYNPTNEQTAAPTFD